MIIYKVTNLVNNKVYIGQSTNSLVQRKAEHYKDAKRQDRPTVYFHNALLKYSKYSFKWEILEEVDNLDALNEREIYWISFYNSTNKTKGYNLKAGGKNGGTCCEETKLKIGNSTKLKWKNPKIAECMSNGLKKGTETIKRRALTNFKTVTCKQCHKNFTYRPCDTKGHSPLFCSSDCLHLYRVNNNTGLLVANETNKSTKKTEKDLMKVKIVQWLPNFIIYKDLPLNSLTSLFEELGQVTGYKDPRTIMSIFGFTSRKLFFKELSKMYAELTGNCKN